MDVVPDVEGCVTDADTGEPIEGAVVVLTEADGDEQARATSRPDGGLSLGGGLTGSEAEHTRSTRPSVHGLKGVRFHK